MTLIRATYCWLQWPGAGGPGAGAEADIDTISQNHFSRSVQSCSSGVTIRGDQAAPFAALSGWMGYHMGRSGQACSPLNTRNSCKYLFSRVQVAAWPGSQWRGGGPFVRVIPRRARAWPQLTLGAWQVATFAQQLGLISMRFWLIVPWQTTNCILS